MTGAAALTEIKVFISSTFRDMDAERDAIKFKVIPRLNRKYRSRGVRLCAVDLRIGVNTADMPEADRENKVLDVCFDSIDRARPFFIGLLGGRYGWIPPEERLDYVLNRLSSDNRMLLSGAGRRSVTELEILYGVIGGVGRNVDHSLFFFRTGDSYGQVPLSELANYIDSDESGNRLKALKDRIVSVTKGTSAYPAEYTLQWDGETARLNAGIDKFADEVFNRLDELVGSSVADGEAAAAWWQAETDNDRYLTASYSTGAAGRGAWIAGVGQQLLSGAKIVCTAPRGAGKSTVAAMLVSRLEADPANPVVLTGYAGANHNSQTGPRLMAKWIARLMAVSGHPAEVDPDMAAGQASRMLAEAVDASERPVVIVLDDFDELRYGADDSELLGWIPRRAAFFGTASPDRVGGLQLWSAGETQLVEPLEPLDDADFGQMLVSWERRNSNELGTAVKRLLHRAKDHLARVAVMLAGIANFSMRDFRSIRAMTGDSEMDKITGYVTAMIERSARSDARQFMDLAAVVARNFDGADTLVLALRLIALSEVGLRDSDLAVLLGDKFDPLDFQLMMTLLDSWFYEDRISHRWRYRSQGLSREVVAADSDALRLYGLLADYTGGLDSDDRLRCDTLLLYSLRAGTMPRWAPDLAFADDTPASQAVIRSYFRVSVGCLMRDIDSLAALVEQASGSLSASERVFLIRNIVNGGVPQLTAQTYLLARLFPIVGDIDPSTLPDAAAAYDYGLLAAGMRIDDPARQIAVFVKAREAFERSLSLDAAYRDAANMSMAMKAELIRLYAASGDFESMQTLF